jgi:rhodanese-related sulfurtransferase
MTMSIRFILSVVFVFLGFVAAILPQKRYSSSELDAQQLLNELQLETFVISPDEMAEAIINNDPSYQLIDLRSPEEVKKFSLPGALNIPFDSLLHEKWAPYIDQVARKNVFYSNGTMLASQAWVLTRQKGYRNNYILEGGLNYWFDTIIKPREPKSTDDEQAIAIYHRRLGAKQYFTGQGGEASTVTKARKPIPRKKKKMVQGGCS